MVRAVCCLSAVGWGSSATAVLGAVVGGEPEGFASGSVLILLFEGTCGECVWPQWFYGLPGILWLSVWGL